MDPVSQGILGAVAAMSFARREEVRPAIIVGILGGMAADMDVFIRSGEDPLLFLDYHRHFTHSLLFVPLGGILVAALCWLFLRRVLSFKKIYLFSVLGYGTHGLLDACTSYGTHLYWPFLNERVAWSFVSIIDLAFTVPLILLVSLGFLRRKSRFGWMALVWAFGYLGVGAWQHGKVIKFVQELAESRNDQVMRVVAHPSIGNLVLWRTLYETPEGEIVVDGIWQGWGESRLYAGERKAKFVLQGAAHGIDPESRLWKDIERFYYFSSGWIAEPEGGERANYVLGDLRYGMIPNSLEPLWGIEVRQGRAGEHTPFLNLREIKDGDVKQLWKMVRGDE